MSTIKIVVSLTFPVLLVFPASVCITAFKPLPKVASVFLRGDPYNNWSLAKRGLSVDVLSLYTSASLLTDVLSFLMEAPEQF